MTATSHPSDKWIQPRNWTFRDKIRSRLSRWVIPAKWDSIETLALFIGTPRAGASMFSALLDAHPHMCIANEYNALGCYVDSSRPMPSRRDLLADILWSSRKQSKSGRAGYNGAGGEYKYEVPEQFQGHFTEPLKVVGAAKAGVTLLILQNQLDSLKRLQDTVSVPVKFVHVVRNPFDLFSTLHKSVKRRGETRITTHIDCDFLTLLEENAKAISWHKDCASIISEIQQTLGTDSILTLHQEEIVSAPKQHLRKTTDFFGLAAATDWEEDCAKIVWDNPHKSRNDIPWNSDAIEVVTQLISECPHLNGFYGGEFLSDSKPSNLNE